MDSAPSAPIASCWLKAIPGRIDLVTISGVHADIHVLREGLQSPPAVTRVGNTVYALEGKNSVPDQSRTEG